VYEVADTDPELATMGTTVAGAVVLPESLLAPVVRRRARPLGSGDQEA
jgi:hypothetical protein